MRKLRTPLLNAGAWTITWTLCPSKCPCVITAEGASQTDREGKQLNNSRVGAQINYYIKQNSGYGCNKYL